MNGNLNNGPGGLSPGPGVPPPLSPEAHGGNHTLVTELSLAGAATSADLRRITGAEADRPLEARLVDFLKRGEVELFNKTRPARGIDLSGIELKGLDLRKVDLSRCKLLRADFRNARLEGADLSEADLSRADLSGTFLSEAKFTHAVLDYANLSHVREADRADFQSAGLLRADLSGGNFAAARFNYARLDGATLSGSDFSYGEFVEARLPGALLNATNFHAAHLERARLFQATGIDVDFSAANLCNAEAVRTRFASSGTKRSDGGTSTTSFKDAWTNGLVHDGFGVEEALLHEAKNSQHPPEGMFPQRQKPELKKREIPGMPGTNLELYEQALAELEGLIGLKEVKGLVKEQFAMMRFQHARSQRGLAEADLNLHFVFTGPPGTGKTTVARIISKLLHATGYLKKGHLVEVQKSHLIGGYQGQTPMKTEDKVKEALDGTLFIDEAYSLTQSEHDDYSKDCIATILKMMEDYRGRISVIAAGYSKEMQTFIKSNSGLESRFTIFIDFPSYSNAELVDIMKRMLDSKQFTYDGTLLGQASVMLAVLKSQKNEKEFANARIVRNLVQQSVLRMAKRVESNLDAAGALTQMTSEDLPFEKIFASPHGSLDFSRFRWKSADGRELTIGQLPNSGQFPELTAESVEMAESIGKLRDLEESEERLDELEHSISEHKIGAETQT